MIVETTTTTTKAPVTWCKYTKSSVCIKSLWIYLCVTATLWYYFGDILYWLWEAARSGYSVSVNNHQAGGTVHTTTTTTTTAIDLRVQFPSRRRRSTASASLTLEWNWFEIPAASFSVMRWWGISFSLFLYLPPFFLPSLLQLSLLPYQFSPSLISPPSSRPSVPFLPTNPVTPAAEVTVPTLWPNYRTP